MAILDMTDLDEEARKKIFESLTRNINHSMFKLMEYKPSDYYCTDTHSLKLNKYLTKKDGPYDPEDYIDPVEAYLR